MAAIPRPHGKQQHPNVHLDQLAAAWRRWWLNLGEDGPVLVLGVLLLTLFALAGHHG